VKFALFYEIPVARPWNPDSEHVAYQNTLEQAIYGDEMGFHAFWTVEHHFLEEFSHGNRKFRLRSSRDVRYGALSQFPTGTRGGAMKMTCRKEGGDAKTQANL
jgi:hypothetical protein